MAIQYDIQAAGDLLNVRASGKDDSLEEVKAYGGAVVAAAVRHGSRRILCDERELVYNLALIDTFESARFIAESMPHVVQAAIVCNPRSFRDGQFWETVAVNRGLTVKFFQDLAAAAAWLESGPER